MTSLNLYNLCGVNLKSQWVLPYPRWESEGPALGEVEITEGPASLFQSAGAQVDLGRDAVKWYHFACLEDGSTYLIYPGLFEFIISMDGRRISGRALADASWEAFLTYLLGQVLSFALIRQGIEQLHGTVVVVQGRAVGFIGDCGYGKSSLAAAFLKAGHSLLTDDLLVLKDEGTDFLVYPSVPRIKLFPEIAQALLGNQVTGGVQMNPYTDKVIIPLEPNLSCQTPQPLVALFVLRSENQKSPRKRVTLRTLRPRQALLALIANTFNPKITDTDRLKRLHDLTTKLASRLPIKSLSYPRDLSRLPEVVAAICASLPT